MVLTGVCLCFPLFPDRLTWGAGQDADFQTFTPFLSLMYLAIHSTNIRVPPVPGTGQGAVDTVINKSQLLPWGEDRQPTRK